VPAAPTLSRCPNGMSFGVLREGRNVGPEAFRLADIWEGSALPPILVELMHRSESSRCANSRFCAGLSSKGCYACGVPYGDYHAEERPCRTDQLRQLSDDPHERGAGKDKPTSDPERFLGGRAAPGPHGLGGALRIALAAAGWKARFNSPSRSRGSGTGRSQIHGRRRDKPGHDG